MNVPEEGQGIGASLLPILEKLPFLSRCAKTRGWHYVIGWLHRITGIWLVIAMTAHIYNLSSASTPEDAKMKIPALPIFAFFAWASSLVAGFHALNGGRLILYELFGNRNDAAMVRWTFGLSVAYAAMAGFLMITKNQSASALFFWLTAFFAGALTAYAVASRIWKSRHSALWMFQRISGAFLLIAVPAYLLFSHLDPGAADHVRSAVARMQDNVFTGIVLLALAAASLYHAGYGLFSITADYIASRRARAGLTALILAFIAVLVFFTFRILSI